MSRRNYAIPVVDKPDTKTLQREWQIQRQDADRVVLEPLQLEDSPYKKAAVEGYIARLSLSYEKRRPDRLDQLSTSFNSNLGKARSSRVSSSYKDHHGAHKTSLGWRPWSRVETGLVTASSSSPSTFDRTYSRSYMRNYSRPYNADPIVPVASYSTSYSTGTRASRYNTAGSFQDVPYRPNRDYKSHLGSSYRVKSYQRRVVNSGRPSRDLIA